MLTQTPPAQRVTLVATVGTKGDGDSLAGLNVHDLPAGALAYVLDTNRLYVLRKDLSTTQVEGASGNVINSVGSADTGFRWVAVQQCDVAVLVNGTATLNGWALGSPEFFLVSVVTAGGSAGTLHAARTTDHSVTVTSSDAEDTSTVLVVNVPTGIDG